MTLPLPLPVDAGPRSRTVTLTIPWAALCSSNQRNRRGGGKIHAKAYTTSREAIYMVACDQVRGERPVFPRGRLSVAIRFYPPDYRRRDESNLTKGLLDSLQGVVYKDDSQMTDLSFLRADVDEANPRAEVTVTGEAT